MILKEKGWIWKLTWPFAHYNYTTIVHTIYYPKGRPPSEKVIAHEEVHERQIKEHGIFNFYFLYLFCFPFLWNPCRWKWECEAYTVGSGYSEEKTRKILGSAAYGWLQWS